MTPGTAIRELISFINKETKKSGPVKAISEDKTKAAPEEEERPEKMIAGVS